MRKRSISVKLCAGIACVSIAALAPSALAVAQLIEEGALPAPASIVATYQTTDTAGTLLSNATITDDEGRYNIENCVRFISGALWTGADSATTTVVMYRYDNSTGKRIDLQQGTDFAIDNTWYTRDDAGRYIDTKLSVATEAGRYYLKVTGVGSYAGSSCYIEAEVLDVRDIANYYISRDFWDDDDLSNPSVEVYRYDQATHLQIHLTKGTDYEVVGWYIYDYDAGDYVQLESIVPSEPGWYYLKLKGKEPNYTGTTYTYVCVNDSKNIASYNANVGGGFLYTDSDLSNPTIVVERYDSETDTTTQLKQGIDYEVEGWYTYDYETSEYVPLESKVPTAPGEYGIKIQGKNSYSGSTYVWANVRAANDIASYNAHVSGFLYTDSDLSNPTIVVERYDSETDTTTQLKQGVDYEVEGWYTYDYETSEYVPLESKVPTEPGEYGIKIQGKNSYSGSTYVWTDVRAANDISSYVAFIRSTVFTDSDFEKLSVQVERHNPETGMSTSLVQGEDFTVGGWYTRSDRGEYTYYGEAPGAPGEYYLKVVAAEGSKYSGECYVYVGVADSHDISGYQLSLTGDFFVGDNNLSDPSVSLRRIDAGKECTLTQGVEFKVEGWFSHVDGSDYESDTSFEPVEGGVPTQVGEYYLKLTGVEAKGYFGTRYVSINVLSADDLSGYRAYINDTLFADDDLSNVRVVVERDDEESGESTRLVQGKDFVLGSWYKQTGNGYVQLEGTPDSPGMYYLSIQGTGNPYSGKLSVYARVLDPHDLSGYRANALSSPIVGESLEDLPVQIYRIKNGDEMILTKGVDFEIEDGWYSHSNYDDSYTLLDEPPTESGMYYLKANGIGDYSPYSCYVSVQLRGLNHISLCKVAQTVFYLGSDLENPTLTVTATDSATTLVQGEDYTVKGWYYRDEDSYIRKMSGVPTIAGLYYLEITGTGKYEGTYYHGFSVSSADHEHIADEWDLIKTPAAVGEIGTAVRYCTECGEALSTTKVLYGDVCKDGAFDVKDLVMVQRYLAGEGDLNALELQIADVRDKDGVNMKDLVYLAKQLLS